MTMDKFILDVVLLALLLSVVFGGGAVVQLLLLRLHPDRPSMRTWLRSTYTMRRWLTHPYKMSIVAMVWQTNFQQLALTGPVSTFADELDYRSRLYLVLANLIGACICFYALHLRDFEQSIRLEANAYIAMIGTLALWVALVYLTVPLPNTGYGLNLAEAVVIASCIRLPLIQIYRWRLRKLRANPHPTQAGIESVARLRRILAGGGDPEANA